ncbi:MAG: PD40 domain-containing protein [Dethiobacter sp.]|nr:PD40 domain-containing protein [Dethiobacter sp.]
MTLSEQSKPQLMKFCKVLIMLLVVCLPALFLLDFHLATPDEELPLLEEQLPAFQVLSPLIKNNVDLGSPQFVFLMQGAKPLTYVASQEERRLAASLLAKIVREGKGEVVARGPWHQVWPRQGLEILAGCPGLRFYYGRTGDHEAKWTAEILTEFTVLGMPGDVTGSLLFHLNAAYIVIDPEDNAAWLITMAYGLPDERSLRSFDTYGYTRSGETMIVRLKADAEQTAELAALLARLKEQLPLPQSSITDIQKRIKEAEQEGRWQDAAQAYEELLSAGGFAVRFDPMFYFNMGKARIRAGIHWEYAIMSILEASYLAEQQGEKRLLGQIAAYLSDYLKSGAPIQAGHRYGIDRFAWQRLVELNPRDGHYWWKLTELFLPALPFAEKADPAHPGDRRAAGLHFRRAGELILSEGQLAEQDPAAPAAEQDPAAPAAEQERREAARQMIAAHFKRGLELERDHPYGNYLKGIYAEIVAADLELAAKQMEKVLALLPGQPNALRRLLQYQALPAKQEYDASWDFSQPKEKYGRGGPAVSWSPDGRKLAVMVHVSEPDYRQDLLLVDRASGKITRLAGRRADRLFWSPDSEWLYTHDSQTALLKRLRGDGSKESVLAREAQFPALSPDGKQIAYSNNGIWLISSSGGLPRQLSAGKEDTMPLWYPDGRHLLFAADSGRASVEYRPVWRILTRLNIDNPEKREILVREAQVYSAYDWLIPGQVLGVSTGWDDAWNWWMLHQSGEIGETPQWTLGYQFFAWLPGKGVAVLAHNAQDGVSMLEIRDVNGKILYSSQFCGFMSFPPLERVWLIQGSPCGKFLAVAIQGPGGGNLWVVNAGENLDFRLIAPLNNESIFWSPISREIGWFDGRTLKVRLIVGILSYVHFI